MSQNEFSRDDFRLDELSQDELFQIELSPDELSRNKLIRNELSRDELSQEELSRDRSLGRLLGPRRIELETLVMSQIEDSFKGFPRVIYFFIFRHYCDTGRPKLGDLTLSSDSPYKLSVRNQL